MVCTEAGEAVIQTIKIANPLNNSYVPEYLYLRFNAVVHDDESFIRMISEGEIELCISNDKLTTCGLNILEELRLDPFAYIDFHDDNTKVIGNHEDMKARDFQLKFDLKSPSHSSPLCTATLKLKCCVGNEFYAKQELLKKERQLSDYSLHIDTIIKEAAPFSSGRPPLWSHCYSRDDVEYAIGIKSWAFNFQLRQAIRNSYLSYNLEVLDKNFGTKKRCAKFIVGAVGETDTLDSHRTKHLLQMEQAVYGDLLLDEQIPGVVDSYYNLLEKVVAFFRWLSSSSDLPRHIVVTDDDVYVNVSDLTIFLSSAPTKSLYTGETIYHRKPMRDVKHINYLSVEDWPDDELIPFVDGNFYILSSDVVTLIINDADIATNNVKSIGTLEDVSIAAWLRSFGIFPTPSNSVLKLTPSVEQMYIQISPSRFLALFDVKLENYFSAIHNNVLSSQGIRKDDDNAINRTEYFVFISPQSLYSIMFIDRMLRQKYPQGTFSYHTLHEDGWESLGSSNLSVDFLIVSPNDAIIEVNDNTIDKFDSNRLLALQYIVQKFDVDQVVLISGEALNLRSIESATRDGNKRMIDLLITTTTDSNYVPNWSNHHQFKNYRSAICRKIDCWSLEGYYIYYVPVISMAFAEMAAYDSPYLARHLLQSRGLEWAINISRSKIKNNDIAYLYHRCVGGLRSEREMFYRYVKARLPNSTHALGKCGSIADDLYHFDKKRYSKKYLDEAVDVLKSYKFVIAFENSIAPGYITEKLALAYLSGAIPIYFGTRDVENYFNMKSMIHCGLYRSMEECANFVLKVNGDNEMYLQILAEPAITSGSKFEDLFSWII